MNPTRTTFALPNHPNRSRAASAARNPTPDEIVGERFNARLTQTEAARLIHSTLRTWQDWEAGKARMHPGLWELFILKTRA
ncbi:MAG TPA: XRE family transcriptional regulator [Kiritimatiellia bacterium]|nr:XRE family transcriptional regulator [Kiritimatiellia bacterium]